MITIAQIEVQDIDYFLNNNKSLFNDIITNNKAFVVKKFLNETVLNQVKLKIKSEKFNKHFLHNNMGYTFPETIYALNQLSKEEICNYHLEASEFSNNTFESLGCTKEDVFDKLSQIFNAKINTIQLNNNCFTPFSLRYLKPGFGEMSLHCEKDLKQFSTYFYNAADNVINSNNIISYFILINKPKINGRFFVYDITMEDVIEKTSNMELKLLNKKKVNIEDGIEFKTIDTEEGDLFIFNGGDIWHRAEIVNGNQPRITIGGFLAKGKNDDHLYSWS